MMHSLKVFSQRMLYPLAQKKNMVTQTESKQMLTIYDMPHPRSLPIFGSKIELLLAGSGKKLHDYIDNRHKKLGSVFYEALQGKQKLVFISDPSLMKSLFLNLEGKYPAHLLPEAWTLYEKLHGKKRGLFFMDGEEWLANRRVMNKHLLRDDTGKWIEEPVKLSVTKFIKNWKNRAAESDYFTPNLESEFYRFSTDVIISILLGSNNTLKLSQNSEMILNGFSESVKKIFEMTTQLYGMPVEWYQRLNLKRWRDFEESINKSLFLAQKIVVEMLNNKHENKGLIKILHDEKLNDETIKKIIADFVIAAGDTTAYTTLWIIHLLSKHQDIIKETRSRDKNYVSHIVRESMRLYPVAPFLTRILPKDSILNDYKLESGTPVVASIYTSGRDEQNFSQAGDFLPYRWDRNDPRKNELKNHVPSASLPFALGARSCIGKKIAMSQMTELIYQIVNQFDIKCLNETEVKPITTQVLVPDRDVKIAVSRRK